MKRSPWVSVSCLFGLVFAASAGCGGGAGGADARPAARTDAFSCGLPSCFTDVIESCQPSGSCKTESTSTTSTDCYANGVRESVTRDPIPKSATATVTKANGTPCWSYEVPFRDGTQPETLDVPYKDGSGRVFAQVTWQFEKNQRPRALSVTCPGGSPQTWHPMCFLTMLCGCGLAPDGSQRCTPGRCG